MYKCSVQYGYNEVMALNSLLEKTNRKPSIKATRISLYLMGVLIIAAGFISIPNTGVSVSALVPMAAGVGLLYMGKQYVHFNTKNSLRNIERMLGTMNFVFKKSGFEVTDRRNTVVLNYLDFDEIIHYDGMWFLFRNKTKAYILPESNFYEGDLSELPEFIRSKTGKLPTELQ